MSADIEPRWYESRRNLANLLAWLIEEGEIGPGFDYVYFIERPAKWQPEWERFLDANRENLERLVERAA